MKRILVFGITENPGGVESVIINYYRHINRNNIQFDFLCNTETVAYEEEIKNLGGNIYRITARSKDRKKYKKDIVNFFKYNASNYSTIWVNLCSLANIDYLKYAKKYGIKNRIIHSHNSQNMDSKLRGILHKINRHFIVNYATDFWSCSEEAGRWFYNRKIIDSDKYLIINNAIDVEKYKFNEIMRKKYRKDLNIDDKIVFGNVGRLHFQKNQDFLIDIFNKFHEKKTNSVLLLIGQGEDYEKLVKKVDDLNLSQNVLFLGIRNDIENLLQAIDFFVFPSVFEGLPVVLIEAQAAGLPIFASSTISKAVKITSNFEFISLAESSETWANRILEKEKLLRQRKNTTNEISVNGYDIVTECKKIENYLKR